MIWDIPLDTKTIDSSRLNIADKTRSNLFAWNGQFSPQLAQILLQTYTEKNDFVVDPFLGSGTVLIEAARHGLQAFGSEINPAAFLMAQTYQLINCRPQDRDLIVQEMEQVLRCSFAQPDLFVPSKQDSSVFDYRAKIISLWKAEENVRRKELLETVIIMSDFYKDNFDSHTILSAWNRLTSVIGQLPYSEAPLSLSLADARNLPLSKASVDFILTSPPYINVFNYHQQYRASAEALGWDLLHVARSEIGSNRKNRGNRFLTVIQYCLDIAQTLVELRRVCKPDARIVFVVGRESNVLKTPFYNGDIVSQLGVMCGGLLAEKRQERKFTNRFGATITEDIIHFRVSAAEVIEGSVTVVAEEALCSAYDRAPEASKPAIREAISKLGAVKPSPIFEGLNQKKCVEL